MGSPSFAASTAETIQEIEFCLPQNGLVINFHDYTMLAIHINGIEFASQPTEAAALSYATNFLQACAAPTTITIHAAAGGILASLTNRRIKGSFLRQVWGGRKMDQAMDCGTEEFDATAAILMMPIEALHALQDNDESTDQIGRLYVDWDGPYEVSVVDSILAYFGVEALTDITAAQLAYARGHLPDEADFAEQTVELSLRLRVRLAPGADLTTLTDSLDYQVRSTSAGVVVLASEIARV